MSIFRFKQFSIAQHQSAMKLGTDSVLLGCLVEAQQNCKLLDIGTGTGILALMMAQRFNAIVDAVEVDDLAAQEAEINVKNSNWHKQITIHHQPIQQFAQQQQNTSFDVIISNPPYYNKQAQTLIANTSRSNARQTGLLSYKELVASVVLLLNHDGIFWLILPANCMEFFLQEAKNFGLYLQQQINIYPKPNKECNRVVLALAKNASPIEILEIIVYNIDGSPSSDHKKLTVDFYTGKQFAS